MGCINLDNKTTIRIWDFSIRCCALIYFLLFIIQIAVSSEPFNYGIEDKAAGAAISDQILDLNHGDTFSVLVSLTKQNRFKERVFVF